MSTYIVWVKQLPNSHLCTGKVYVVYVADNQARAKVTDQFSISAALSCLVYPASPREGRSAGSFPEQRLVIEPKKQ